LPETHRRPSDPKQSLDEIKITGDSAVTDPTWTTFDSVLWNIADWRK
jgi:hypothetical protein